MVDSTQNKFQVALGGLIDLLSQHLYTSPAVFVRELLQNCVDAISARQAIEPNHTGNVQFELVQQENGPATLTIVDDGIGLTEADLHTFLATIGQSSKQGKLLEQRQDFLGQFGIGLLSCFMVTDEIVVISKSARDVDAPPVEWRGRADGTYGVRKLNSSFPAGTQVFLRAKSGSEEYFQVERLQNLIKHYGEFLPSSIHLTYQGQTTQLNSQPIWEEGIAEPLARERLLERGSKIFDRSFLDVFPLRAGAGRATGMAFVLADPAAVSAKQKHRVYLKNMLVSGDASDLLPDWAFFVHCVVNAQDLRPTASREAFYEDARLEAVREELGSGLRSYLMNLAREQPDRLGHLLSIHDMAVKALAAEDDECLEVFADWLPFETSQGTMTLHEYRTQHPVIRYISTRDQFRQIAPVATSESIAVINAGYAFDEQILQRLAAVRPELDIEVFAVEDLADRFQELSPEELEDSLAFVRRADAVLQPFKAAVELAHFRPQELPALYVTNANADFLRSIDQSRDVADEMWTGVLDNLATDVASNYSRLHLNYSNPLVRRIARLPDAHAQRRCVEMLYVQALLLGHFPLNRRERDLVNSGLLGLLDWALNAGGDNR